MPDVLDFNKHKKDHLKKIIKIYEDENHDPNTIHSLLLFLDGYFRVSDKSSPEEYMNIEGFEDDIDVYRAALNYITTKKLEKA